MRMKKWLAVWTAAWVPMLASAQTTGSGTVEFQFLNFRGPFAAATQDNLATPEAWVLSGLVNGVNPASVIPNDFLSWSSAGSPSSNVGFIQGSMLLAPAASVSLRYAFAQPGSSLDNVFSFTPRPFTGVAVGQDFVLGTLSFQNGGWLGAGFTAYDNVPTVLDFAITTRSADGSAFNQMMFGQITMVTHSPQDNDLSTLAGQQAEADFIYVTDYANPSLQMGALRVFDDCCHPVGAVSTGSVDLVARFNSLDLVALANPVGGFLTESIEPLPGVAPVPEPETWLMLLAGAALIGGAVRRRLNETPGCASPARPAAA